MANDYEPWVSADKEIQELTIRVVIIGILLGAVMTAMPTLAFMLV